MASEIKMKTDELYSETVKRRLLNVFQEMTNKISPDHFNEIFKEFKGSGTVVKNEDQIVQTFKEDLYRNICDNFMDMWKLQEIDLRLNSLQFCKEKCAKNTSAWRPTGKTPEEQTQYLRIHYLKKKISFLNDALQCQADSFYGTCQEVESKRAIIEELSARRDEVSRQMDTRMHNSTKLTTNIKTFKKI